MTILAILLVIVSSVISKAQQTWTYASNRTTQFREARTAFDLVTRYLSQATLNTYWDYDTGGMQTQIQTEVSGTYTAPNRYRRQSELQFICDQAKTLITSTDADSGAGNDKKLPFHAVFFQALLGVTDDPTHATFQNLLTGRGYFVQFSDDKSFRPPFVTQDRWRYRLMEYAPSTESNQIYITYKKKTVDGIGKMSDWFKDAGTPIKSIGEIAATGGANAQHGFTRPVAENIIALVIAPKASRHPVKDASGNTKDPYWIAPNYHYDSTAPDSTTKTVKSPQGSEHLLPPLMDVIMIALDESSAQRLAYTSGVEPPLDLTSVAKFDKASDDGIKSDLGAIEAKLLAQKLNYRVFSATIEIRGSRWSL